MGVSSSLRIVYQLPEGWPAPELIDWLRSQPYCGELIPLSELNRAGIASIQPHLVVLFSTALSGSDLLVTGLMRPISTLIVFSSIEGELPRELLSADNLAALVPFSSVAESLPLLRIQLERVAHQQRHTGLQLETLIDNLKTAVLFERSNREVALVNERFCEMFGIPLATEQLVGQDCAVMMEQAKGFFRDPDRFIQLTEQAVASRRAFRDQGLEAADGRQLIRHYTPILREGVLMGHLWQYQDVTWQKQIEAQLRAANDQLQTANEALDYQNQLLAHEREQLELILTNADILLFVADKRGVIVRAEGKGLPKLGLNANRYLGRNVAEYVKYAPRILDVFETGRRGHQVSREVGLGPFVFLYTLTPVFDAFGEVELVVCFMTDITERKIVERDLIRARELAESAVEAKERFLASMSHEIRTPLNGIVGLTNLLQQTPLNLTQVEYLQGLRASTDTLMGILNDVLDLSKIRAGKLDVETIAFSMRSLLANLRRTLEPKAREKRLTLEVHVAPEVPAILLGDPTRINQILWNLVSNALKFTEQGLISIHVGIIEQTSKRIELSLEVRDTGIGIAPDRLSAIFDSFTQATADTARLYGGTGLGLSIVRELVHLLGGVITVHSKVGVGSSFRTTLSFERAPESVTQPAHLASSDWATEWIGPYNALVVEDNLVNQLIAQRLLEAWGLQVTVANHGHEALSIINARLTDEDRPADALAFDLVLMDLRMPELDGYDTSMAIRRMAGPIGQVPIIAVTAQALREEKSRCLELGMNDYVAKPFEPRRLFQAIARHLSPKSKELHATAAPPPAEASAPMPTAERPQRFSLDYLVRFFDGNAAMVDEIVSLSIDEIGKDMTRMAHAYADHEADDVSLIAHRLKTNLAQLGDAASAKLLEQIEHTIKQHQQWPEASLMAEAQAGVAELLVQLRTYAQATASAKS